MNFANELFQIAEEKKRKTISDIEVYNAMLNQKYRDLKEAIRREVRKTGELSGTIMVSESVGGDVSYDFYQQIEHKKTDSYEVTWWDSVCWKFMPFCKYKFEEAGFFKIKKYYTVLLTDIGKNITEELKRLFNEDGIEVWFSVTHFFSDKPFKGYKSRKQDLDVSVEYLSSAKFGTITLIMNYKVK